MTVVTALQLQAFCLGVSVANLGWAIFLNLQLRKYK